MALAITEVNTAQHKYFDRKKVSMNQVYEEDPFLSRLLKNNKVITRGGTSIQYSIRYRKYGKADAVGPDKQTSFERKTTRTGADLDWKYYSVDSMITQEEQVKNTGQPQIIDLLADKEEEMRQDFTDRIATDVYTTNPNGLGISSLAEIVDSADTYAGIAVSDAAAWAGNEDSSTTELLLYGTNSLSYWCNQATFGRKMPTLINTTRDLASKFESLVEPQKRYTDKETANAGFPNVTFHGIPVVGNPYVPASVMYGLCVEMFELRIAPDFNFEVTPWTNLLQGGFAWGMGRVMSLVFNLLCRMRQVNFKFTALDYTI
jgi:hypothetical protein